MDLFSFARDNISASLLQVVLLELCNTLNFFDCKMNFIPELFKLAQQTFELSLQQFTHKEPTAAMDDQMGPSDPALYVFSTLHNCPIYVLI